MIGLLAVALLPTATMASHPRNGGRAEAEAQSAEVPGEKMVDLALASGSHQRVLFAAPAQARGILVMLPGGAGDIGLEADGYVLHGHNFVVRTRAAWVRKGYAVVIPDSVDGENLRGRRSSPAYAALVEDLVRFAHAQSRGPVYLIGTSQGSIAAMNGAAHAPAGSIAGVVLTESVSIRGGSGETVYDADPANVRVRALVVANRDDRCDVAPPDQASHIAAAMTHSADVQVLMVSGGIERSSKACGSLSPHGYYGIEAEVIDRIDAWMGLPLEPMHPD